MPRLKKPPEEFQNQEILARIDYGKKKMHMPLMVLLGEQPIRNDSQ